jgi:hypothetical protein
VFDKMVGQKQASPSYVLVCCRFSFKYFVWQSYWPLILVLAMVFFLSGVCVREQSYFYPPASFFFPFLEAPKCVHCTRKRLRCLFSLMNSRNFDCYHAWEREKQELGERVTRNSNLIIIYAARK